LVSGGDRTILGEISRRGNRYLRVLFVQAAWVVLIKPKSWERRGLEPWIEAAEKRLHHNVLAIALANKLARIAWAVHNQANGGDQAAAASQQPDQPGVVEAAHPRIGRTRLLWRLMQAEQVALRPAERVA
jgi:hypothetical protein